jgi:pimeloyl-ACP methyl ester carboxylesterase
MKRKVLLVLLVLVILVILGVAGYIGVVSHRVEGETFESDGVRIHYTDQGQGEPVLLIHGFAANADLNWRLTGILEALADNYRVIALDNRGHGLSDKPHDPEAYSDLFVEDAIALLDHLDIDKAHVVGYSMGSLITTKLITQYPERAITAAPCGAGWVPPEERETTLLFFESLAHSLEAGNGFVPLLEMLYPGSLARAFRVPLINFVLKQVNDEPALAAVSRSFHKLQMVTEEELQSLSVPVLQVVGGEDPLRIGVEAMAELVPNLQLVIIPGADHLTTLPHPELKRALLEFLRSHPLQP